MVPIAPVRTDGVVTLRPFRPDDVDDVVVMGRDPETVRFTTVPHPYERRHAEEWVAEPGKERETVACWAIEADDGGAARSADTPARSATSSRPGPAAAGS